MYFIFLFKHIIVENGRDWVELAANKPIVQALDYTWVTMEQWWNDIDRETKWLRKDLF